uniref:Uncharacterized protein n=1 Tax=Anguilla anguilla TaxID=7936 RepID=A0A0E9SN40_ANGAN
MKICGHFLLLLNFTLHYGHLAGALIQS